MKSKLDLVKLSSVSVPSLFLLIFFVIPMTTIFWLSFSEKSGIVDIVFTGTWDNYIRIFDPIYAQIFGYTVYMSLLGTFICFIIAFILALCIVFAKNEKFQNILLFLVMLPFWINMLIRTYALIVILRTKGIINLSAEMIWQQSSKVVEALGIAHWGLLSPTWKPFELIYNDVAILIGLVYVYVPFMVLPMYASLNKIDKSCLEASYDMGAGHFRTMIFVVIPMIKFGVISGILITFIPMLGSFLIPDLLGGKSSIMIASVIASQFTGTNDWPFGSAMSSVLIYITFFVIAYKYYFESKNKVSV